MLINLFLIYNPILIIAIKKLYLLILNQFTIY